MKTIYYWPCGAGYFACVNGEPHFALDPQEFLNRASITTPKKLYRLKKIFNGYHLLANF